MMEDPTKEIGKNKADGIEFMRKAVEGTKPLDFETLFGGEELKMFAKIPKDFGPKTKEQREAEIMEGRKRIKELEGKPMRIFDGPLDEPEMTKEMQQKLCEKHREYVEKKEAAFKRRMELVDELTDEDCEIFLNRNNGPEAAKAFQELRKKLRKIIEETEV